MSVVYKAVFQYEEPTGRLLLNRIAPDGFRDTSSVSLKKIEEIDETCRSFRWNWSSDLSEGIGKKLFDILNGDNQSLVRALKTADDHGERLEVYVSSEKYTANLPFELLYYSDFLMSSRMHLVRRVSDWGSKRIPHCGDHPLRILFMACSPHDVQSVLEFEKEEDIIFEITKNLAVEIDVEDTGSLDGFAECLVQNEYDVVHLSGHADIDKQGVPFFCMEDEEGLAVWITAQQLLEKLNLNLPQLLFLSGCRTGEAPVHAAAASFAQHLVANHSSTCVGWGLPVSDPGATLAAKQLYFDLSRGKNILEAVFTARQELLKHNQRDWSLLRLFSDGTPLTVPLVQGGQRKRVRQRDLQYTYLHNSQVKVLKRGFVGRRRQIQQGLRCLKKDEEKVGFLLHGTGGLGKSCLAGKFCERFKDHTLIIVHGMLDTVTLGEALKDAFIRAKDKLAQNILEMREEIPDKLRSFCSSSFQEKPYLILLDDFEKNLTGVEEGKPEVSSETLPILETLLKFLPYSGKMTQLIITSRYTFSLIIEGIDLVKQRLEAIGLMSFRGSDEWKKISELDHIASYPNPDTRQQLIKAGCGNPQLMEALDTLVAEAKNLDLTSLLSAVKNKHEEFVQKLILREILKSQPDEFQMFVRRSAVYRLPVLKEGIQLVCAELKDLEPYVNQAVRLSLMEQDTGQSRLIQYWVTPLLSKDILGEQGEEEKKSCHTAAMSYYQRVLSKSLNYAPIMAFELIEHALRAEMQKLAIEKEGELLSYLRNCLAYREALSHGEYLLSQISEPRRDAKFAKFLFELGSAYHDIGNAKRAIEYYEEVLLIRKRLYGGRHPDVATIFSSLGLAWGALGYLEKAIEYGEEALSIHSEEYGKKNPDVAVCLSNLGTAWLARGDLKKAISYYEEALLIGKELYAGRHPGVAKTLNNLGTAWYSRDDMKKAVKYGEEALSIAKQLYGEKHPDVAVYLNNLGNAWYSRDDLKKAISYYEEALLIGKELYGKKHPHVAKTLNNLGNAADNQNKKIEYYEAALSIAKELYGEKHPDVVVYLNNLGNAWCVPGNEEKAIGYCKKALSIAKELYGEKHPHVAACLHNLGCAWEALGDKKEAIECFRQAYEAFREFYGVEHPSTKIAKKRLDDLRNKEE